MISGGIELIHLNLINNGSQCDLREAKTFSKHLKIYCNYDFRIIIVCFKVSLLLCI